MLTATDGGPGARPAPIRGKPEILVVDDDEETRVIVAEILEDFGYSVVQADGGTTALRLLKENPGLQLIISDIRMPGMSGIELADLVTARRADLKVILMSGFFIAQRVMHHLLHKPFRMQDLKVAVQAVLEGAD